MCAIWEVQMHRELDIKPFSALFLEMMVNKFFSHTCLCFWQLVSEDHQEKMPFPKLDFIIYTTRYDLQNGLSGICQVLESGTFCFPTKRNKTLQSQFLHVENYGWTMIMVSHGKPLVGKEVLDFFKFILKILLSQSKRCY